MARAKNIVSVARNLGLVLGVTLGLAACSTVQENPNYQYSTKYTGAADTSYASNGAVTTPATYTQASTQTYQGQTFSGSTASRAAEQDCRRKEGNREIIGGAAGGALGAFAGKKLIGGTGGTLAGAAVGGVVGYGIGDISVDCSPAQTSAQTYQPAATQAQAYQPAATQVQTYQTAPVAYEAAPATYQAAPAPYSAPITAAPTDVQYAGQAVNGTPGYEVWQSNNRPQTIAETVGQPVGQPVQLYSSNVQTTGAQQLSNYDYSENLISANTPVNGSNVLASETRILGGNSGFQSYRVQPGDTVYGLSRKLCSSVSEIQTQNNINANYGIQIGQTITLPQSRC